MYFTLKHFCYLKLVMHFMRSKKLTSKKQKVSPKNKKDLGMACLTPTCKKSEETRENVITQPRSHPIPKFYILLMGWDRSRVMAFPLVSSLWESEYCGSN